MAWKNKIGTTEKGDDLGSQGFAPGSFIEGAEELPSSAGD